MRRGVIFFVEHSQRNIKHQTNLISIDLLKNTITGDRGVWDQTLLVNVGKYIGFVCVSFSRFFIQWFPVIQYRTPSKETSNNEGGAEIHRKPRNSGVVTRKLIYDAPRNPAGTSVPVVIRCPALPVFV